MPNIKQQYLEFLTFEKKVLPDLSKDRLLSLISDCINEQLVCYDGEDIGITQKGLTTLRRWQQNHLREETTDDVVTAGSTYYIISKQRVLMEFNRGDKLSVADILDRSTTPNNWGYDDLKHTLEGMVEEGLLKRHYEQYMRN